MIEEKPVKDYSRLKAFFNQQEVKHQGQIGWVLGLLLEPRLVCVLHETCVRAIEVDSVFSPWCFLVLSQSQGSVTGDKARLLPRQEEMELGSSERATHNCIYIILEGSSTLNLCAVISEVLCLHRESCSLFRELPTGINKNKGLPFNCGGNLSPDLLIKLCLPPACLTP